MLFTSRFTAPDITWVLDKLIFVSYFFILEIFFVKDFSLKISLLYFCLNLYSSLFSIRFSFFYIIFINIRNVGFDIELATTNTERNRFYLFFIVFIRKSNDIFRTFAPRVACIILYLLPNYAKVIIFSSKLANRKLNILPMEDRGFKTISLYDNIYSSRAWFLVNAIDCLFLLIIPTVAIESIEVRSSFIYLICFKSYP